jgi:O-antigen chain-terminating methyltransferase
VIETTVPEISVSELMERIRAEAKRPGPERVSRATASNGAAPALPPLATLPRAPWVCVPSPVNWNKARVDQLLQTARENNGNSRLPKFLRRFFRKQGALNRGVLETISALAKTNADLTQRVTDMTIVLGQLHSWLMAVHEQTEADSNWLKAAAPAVSGIPHLQRDLENVARDIGSARAALETTLTEQIDTVSDKLEISDADRSELRLQLNHIAQNLKELGLQFDERNRQLEEEGAQRRLEQDLQLQDRDRQLQAQDRQLQDRDRQLQEQEREMQERDRRLQEIGERLDTTDNRTASELDALRTRIEELRAEIGGHNQATENVAGQANDLKASLDRAGIHLRNLQAQADQTDQKLSGLKDDLVKMTTSGADKLDGLQGQTDRAGLHLRNLQAQADRLGLHINNLQGFVDRHAAESSALHRGFEQRLNDHATLEKKLVALEERSVADAALVKGELSEYGSLFRRILLDAREETTASAGSKKSAKRTDVDSKTGVGLDSFYVGFENRFRGPRNEIKRRVAFYLPFIRKARAGTAARPVLDVGCGRGEWMELLKENDLAVRGVDMNTAMVAQCKARGLEAQRDDAIAYLRSLRANSQGAVTGFHIIEHLGFETLLELFRQARRVLKPGGLVIFESPNCKNLIVGSCNFYIDPTHRNPVFPETAEFMLAAQGFEKIRIEYLSPIPNDFAAGSPELATLRELLYGPQDFGVIAYKPKTR